MGLEPALLVAFGAGAGRGILFREFMVFRIKRLDDSSILPLAEIMLIFAFCWARMAAQVFSASLEDFCSPTAAVLRRPARV